jgi:hypothetical protein
MEEFSTMKYVFFESIVMSFSCVKIYWLIIPLQGHDTTAAGVAWCLYVLGRHLDAQVSLACKVIRRQRLSSCNLNIQYVILDLEIYITKYSWCLLQ